MKRRTFFKTALAASAAMQLPKSVFGSDAGKIMTVSGAIDSEKAGIILPHEHVMSAHAGG